MTDVLETRRNTKRRIRDFNGHVDINKNIDFGLKFCQLNINKTYGVDRVLFTFKNKQPR